MLSSLFSVLAFLAFVSSSVARPVLQRRDPSFFTKGPYSLPPLDFAYDALQPVISEEIMKLHYLKHHNTYIEKLNNGISVEFNGGGFINHSLFWKNLAPPNTTKPNSNSALVKAIKKKWGTLDKFYDEFTTEGLGVQGSGWVWLVKNKHGRLEIVTRENQKPILEPNVPIVGVDVWEHGYYLQYKNDRKGYLTAIWKAINWDLSSRRYDAKVDFKPAGFKPEWLMASFGF